MLRSSVIAAHHRGAGLYKVKAKDPRGRLVIFACGTPDQAFEKVVQLAAQGFGDVSVTDPAGKDRPAEAFKALLLNGEL